jgi:hypothetical protein
MPKIQTRQAYDAVPALNYSLAKQLLISPLHARQYLDTPREETKALRIGSAVHCAALEPKTFALKYLCGIDVDKRTKAGKEAYEALMATAGDKIVLSPDEYGLVANVALAAGKALQKLGVTLVETETMYSVEYCGVNLKSAIDAVGDDDYLYDLKTCESAAPTFTGALGAIKSYRYNLQGHFYRLVYELATGKRPRGFRLIFIEKEAPYATAIYEIGPNLSSYAVADFEKAVKLYEAGVTFDSWPGYPTDPQVIDIGAEPTKAATPINFA